MNNSRPAAVLIVPGLRDHVADHWQTHLERKLSSVRKVVSVPPLEADKLSCAARVSAVERTIETLEEPVIVVAHSAGVLMLVHWAQAASTNDPLATFDRVRQMAREWGSELVNVGAVGHINPASGFGPWPLAEALIQTLEF